MGIYSNGANNAVLIDVNHKGPYNITPVDTNAAFTSFAFLTAGANNNNSPGYMLNQCILQHADGTNETNYFKGYDWFNSSVANAWLTHGRFAPNSPAEWRRLRSPRVPLPAVSF